MLPSGGSVWALEVDPKRTQNPLLALGNKLPNAGDTARRILAWTLGPTMRVEDVTETLDLARAATGVDRVHVEHKPRLLSENGPCYVSKDLGEYLEKHEMGHTRGRAYRPMTPPARIRAAVGVTILVSLEEFSQALISTRTFSFLDLAASIAGILVGLLASWWIVSETPRHRRE